MVWGLFIITLLCCSKKYSLHTRVPLYCYLLKLLTMSCLELIDKCLSRLLLDGPGSSINDVCKTRKNKHFINIFSKKVSPLVKLKDPSFQKKLRFLNAIRNFLLPVPLTPHSCLFFRDFHLSMLSLLQNITQPPCIVFPYSSWFLPPGNSTFSPPLPAPHTVSTPSWDSCPPVTTAFKKCYPVAQDK